MKLLSIREIYFLFASLLAFIAINAVTPPFMSPDEPHHYSRAYLLTNGVITLNNKDGMKSGGYIDKSLNDSLISFNNGHIGKVSSDMFEYVDGIKWNSERTYKEIPNTAFYFPAVYIPQAVGIGIGRVMSLSILDTYYLSRVLSFISCILIIIYANRVFPIPSIAAFVMVMPMMLFQISSTTIDGITTSLSILMMCLFSHCVLRREISMRSLISISAISFVLVSSRANLIPILLLPFFAAYFSKLKYRMVIPSISVLMSFAWIGFTISITKDGGVNHPGISQGQVISHYIMNPLEIIRISINTIFDHGRFSFYYKSFVGKLGWLDIWMPNYLYTLSIITLITLALLGFSKKSLLANQACTISITLASFGSVALIFCALLVQYSKFPTDVIIGIQGRYFIIPMIIFSFIFLSDARKKNTASYCIVAVFSLISLNAMILEIINRYYM